MKKREEDINNISNISVLQIKKRITDPKDKDLFIKKLYQLSLEKKQILKSSQNKFEATYVKKIGDFIIDKIIKIINSPINESLQKIKIMNIINNSLSFMKIQEKYDTSEKGVSSNYMFLGGQYNQILFINYEDYFSHLERLANIKDSTSSSSNNNHNKKKRSNLLNILSLLHIWNFSLDLDFELWRYFKLAQPIFEFNPVLI